jgi:hypothetical protein
MALIAIVMMGCSKSDDDDGDNGNTDPPGSGSLQMDVDGSTWKANTIVGASAIGFLTISGKDSGSKQEISFLLPDNIETGTHDLSGFGTVYYISADDTTYWATSGTLEITKHNTTSNEVKGTFHFEGDDLLNSSTISVTNGSFDVDYAEAK